VPLSSGPRCLCSTPVDDCPLCTSLPVRRFSLKSPAHTRALAAKNPAAITPIQSDHRPSAAAKPVRLCTCLGLSCPPCETKPSPLSAALMRTLPLPLCHRDAGMSCSMTSRAQHTAAGHSLPPAVATPPRHRGVRSCTRRPTCSAPLGMHTLSRGRLC
jgi:hypothetical protein